MEDKEIFLECLRVAREIVKEDIGRLDKLDSHEMLVTNIAIALFNKRGKDSPTTSR